MLLHQAFWDAAVLFGSPVPAVGKEYPQSLNMRRQSTIIIPTIPMKGRVIALEHDQPTAWSMAGTGQSITE